MLVVACDARRADAERLADDLGVPIADERPSASAASHASDGMYLVLDEDGLSLVADGMALKPDLATALPRLRPARLARELLVRAARIKGASGPLRAVDATAGFGEDALLLAAAGFEVELFERDPVIHALAADALRRAAADPALADVVARMRLTRGDSVAALPHLGYQPDVVYLDPMFPARRKAAAVKKKFQLLHRLERPCVDAEELLAAALAARPRKAVVKRPLKGPDLAGIAPSYRIMGTTVRYDVIVPPPDA